MVNHVHLQLQIDLKFNLNGRKMACGMNHFPISIRCRGSVGFAGHSLAPSLSSSAAATAAAARTVRSNLTWFKTPLDHQIFASRGSCLLLRSVRQDQQPEWSVQQGQQPDSPSPQIPWWERESSPNMVDIRGVQHLVDEMAKAGDRLVIVDFYAEYCNACKALYPKLVRLLQQHQEDTVCLKINWEQNREIARALNIKVLPYFQFYRGAEGKVDQFSCTISKIGRFKDALEQYSGPFISLGEPPGLSAEFPDVKPTESLDEYDMPGKAEDAYRPTNMQSVWWND